MVNTVSELELTHLGPIS